MADAEETKTPKRYRDLIKKGGRQDWAWQREERNRITGETRWAVRQRAFIDTTRLGAEPTGIPGGFGELIGTYDTEDEAIARVMEINLEINVGMSWVPA